MTACSGGAASQPTEDFRLRPANCTIRDFGGLRERTRTNLPPDRCTAQAGHGLNLIDADHLRRLGGVLARTLGINRVLRLMPLRERGSAGL